MSKVETLPKTPQKTQYHKRQNISFQEIFLMFRRSCFKVNNLFISNHWQWELREGMDEGICAFKGKEGPVYKRYLSSPELLAGGQHQMFSLKNEFKSLRRIKSQS